MSFINTSSLLSSVSGAVSKVSGAATKFDPSSVRLGAANLIKGGMSSVSGQLSGALSSIGGPMGGLGALAGGAIGGALAGKVSGIIGGAIGGVIGSNLNTPLSASGAGNDPNIVFGSSEDPTSQVNSPATDWRVKIRCPAFESVVVFPLLPSITFGYKANYNPQSLTHSNYSTYFYQSSEVDLIQITAEFPVQTVAEGEELILAINFFKASTKMYFGSSTNGGNPPPIVFLSGFGERILSEIPCVVTSFQHTMPNEVDYIRCSDTRVPTFSNMTISLQPVVSRAKARQFNHDAYRIAPHSTGFM